MGRGTIWGVTWCWMGSGRGWRRGSCSGTRCACSSRVVRTLLSLWLWLQLRLGFGLRLDRSSHFARLLDSSTSPLRTATPRAGHLCDLNGQLIRAVDAIDLDGFGAAGAADGTAESQLGGQLQAAAMAAAALLGGGVGPEHGGEGPGAAQGPSHRYHYVLFREDGAALGRVVQLLAAGVLAPPPVREFGVSLRIPLGFA